MNANPCFGWRWPWLLLATCGLAGNSLSAGGLDLTSPISYAVFQRSLSNTCRIPISGVAEAPVARVEAKVTLAPEFLEGIDGHSSGFVEIARPGAREFHGLIEAAAGGWYVVTVRALNAAGAVVAEETVAKVGVGEVFVAAGHSFCSNFQGDAPGRAEEDRVATCIDWTNTPPARLAFRHADDPLRPGDARRASPWPAVGDVLVRQWHVPVLIISTGIGGTTVQRWREVAENPASGDSSYVACRATLQRWIPYTGLRALIWFGNENDLNQGPTAEVFSDNFRRLIARSRADAGIPDLPWVIAFDAYDPGIAEKIGPVEMQRRKERIDRGTQKILETVPFTYDGPQTDDLGPEYRRSDHDHFNEAGVRELGIRFARQISRAFFPSPVPVPQAPRELMP
ncbi:MAG: sialate O-acetylesterase [Verrucomicrobiota bacterium]